MISRYWHVDEKGEHEDPNFEPIRIGWSKEARVDIMPHGEILVPFLRIADSDYQLANETGQYGLSGDPKIPQLRFQAAFWPWWVVSRIPPGKHSFQIMIYFENRKPLELSFDIEWSGKWSDQYETMLEQIKVKKRT